MLLSHVWPKAKASLAQLTDVMLINLRDFIRLEESQMYFTGLAVLGLWIDGCTVGQAHEAVAALHLAAAS